MGYSIVKSDKLNRIPHFGDLWHELTEDQKLLVARYIPFCKSQYAQDLFVISELENKVTNKFFVEFGATDGVQWSNTWLLEKKLGWSGILSEPARTWHKNLSLNRSCAVDHRCVTDSTGKQVNFLETGYPTDRFKVSTPELSSISKYANSGDWASKTRLENSIEYQVETISLNDLLIFHNAPTNINYLSIDTEGSELAILRGFDFGKYSVDIVTVEHNNDAKTRKAIYDLLTSYGYVRKHEKISGADDWYILSS